MEAGIQTGTAIQAPLAILGFLLGLAAWWQTGQVGRATGAVAMIADWPFTFFAIMPENHRLMAIEPGPREVGFAPRRT
jgi:hypothetical protein